MEQGFLSASRSILLLKLVVSLDQALIYRWKHKFLKREINAITGSAKAHCKTEVIGIVHIASLTPFLSDVCQVSCLGIDSEIQRVREILSFIASVTYNHKQQVWTNLMVGLEFMMD